ncbi:Ca(2+)-dependent cysteine protease [Gryganskiella cystojenkinii]|nr:Ca(2+)-dependent cysteine protease [Gryganskiella cystojenkinii]
MSSSPPSADCEIDPTVLADVTRVVQELMRLQQEEQEREKREQLQYAPAQPLTSHHQHHHHHDPLDGISTVSREFHDPDALEHADRQDVQVPLLSVHDFSQEQQEEHAPKLQQGNQQEHQHELEEKSSEEAIEIVDEEKDEGDMPSPILLLSASSSVSSLSSYSTAPTLPGSSASPPPPLSTTSVSLSQPVLIHSSSDSSLSVQQQQSSSFQLEVSAIARCDSENTPSKSSLSLRLPETNPTQVLNSNGLLPGQKTPTRSTSSIKGSSTSTTPDEADHPYFSHPPPATQKNNDSKKTWVPVSTEEEPLTTTDNKKNSGGIPGITSESDIKSILQKIKDTTASENAACAFLTSGETAAVEATALIPRFLPAPPTRPRRKKALLIGINYFGDPNQLLGCINDSRDVFGFLNGYFGFRYQDTIILTDDQIYEDKRPTGANIRYWMKWLVKDAEPQDSLFFHYAVGDEADGYDEIIYPCDYLRSGIISDDEMYDILVKELPAGVQLTALVDACHSGTMLDLPYVYNGDQITALEKVTRTKVGAMAAISSGDLDFANNNNNSSNNCISGVQQQQMQTQTQTTTTTTTTTMTTVTTTTKSCPSSPMISAATCASSDPEHPHNNSPVSALDLEKACSKAYLSPMSPALSATEVSSSTSSTVKIQLTQEPVSPRPLSPSIVLSALTPPVSATEATTRSIDSTDDDVSVLEQQEINEHPKVVENNNEEWVPRLTITHVDEHQDQEVPVSSGPISVFSSAFWTPTSSDNNSLSLGIGAETQGLSPRKRSKSVMGDPEDDPDRGIECDAKAWLEVEPTFSVPTVATEAVTAATVTTATSSLIGSRAHSPTLSEMDREDMAEAQRMALFRKTKGNVVMFSGCRDDQASADIRASSKDAAIISNHHKLKNGDGSSTSFASPNGDDKLDENGIPNPLGYSLPQPYTSPMARGAVSYAWIQCLSQKPEQTYEELLTSMRHFMKQRDLDQVPQLGSGMPMDMRTVFTL